jgi:hypothetical protein
MFIPSLKNSICADRRLCRKSNIGDDTKLDIYVAKFVVPYWREKVDYGIGLSYWPTSLCSLTGLYDNPMP